MAKIVLKQEQIKAPSEIIAANTLIQESTTQ